MKVIKKICVYLLVGLITFSSVTLSYEKANSCKAVSLALEIGAVVLGVGLLCYSAYYISQPENQDAVKQALSDYANTTAEGAKMQYEFNKKLFNDFCTYATSKAGSNAAITSADGKKYTVKDMQKEGFPSFEKWDEEMKKQNKKPTPTFGNLWDKMSFGLDLLDFIRGFFDDDKGSTSGGSGGQSYFEGETYYDKETGKFSIFADTMIYKSGSWLNDVFTYDKPIMYHFGVSGVVKESFREDFRLCLSFTNSVYYKLPIDGETDKNNYRYYMQAGGYKFGYHGQVDKIVYDCYTTHYGAVNKYSPGTTSYAVLVDHFLHYDESEKIYSFQPKNYLYLSSNAPFFYDVESANTYLTTGDYSNAINLPPSDNKPSDTPPSDDRPVTPVSIYLKQFENKNVTVNNITNVNYYIVNNWDTTTNQTQNLTTVINNYYGTLGDSECVADTPVPTATPVPTLTNVDGDNTTNNYIINITNILQPIQETVTNIYNFFVIDTDTISEEMQNINVAPVTKFEKIVTRVSNLKSAFSDDVQDDSVQAGVSGTSYGIYYPVIKMKCPSALLDYVDADSLLDVEGKKYIVLIDFADWAVYFVRVRTFMKVALWIGMFFYLLKQIRVTITIS